MICTSRRGPSSRFVPPVVRNKDEDDKFVYNKSSFSCHSNNFDTSCNPLILNFKIWIFRNPVSFAFFFISDLLQYWTLLKLPKNFT